jgi:deazaflavin-dependent oxidoreductase (nitroreductase family)
MTESKPSTGQAKVMTGQKAANALVGTLLRTPLISKGIGRRLVIINVTGRKSGRRYSVPVAYTRHDGVLLVGTPFGWGRNLRTGEPVELILLGKRRLADVEVITDEDGVTRHYAIICRNNSAFAKFNKVTIGPDGTPDPAGLHQAWANGARVFRLTPR